MSKLKPKDTVALTALLVIFFLKFKGLDGTLDAATALILGYYIAHRHNGDDNGH